MGKSGDLIAFNDCYIHELLKDPMIRVLKEVIVETLRDTSGHVQDVWRDVSQENHDGYRHIKYTSSEGRKDLKCIWGPLLTESSEAKFFSN